MDVFDLPQELTTKRFFHMLEVVLLRQKLYAECDTNDQLAEDAGENLE